MENKMKKLVFSSILIYSLLLLIQFAAGDETDSPITSSDSFFYAIDSNADTDSFTFNANAGQSIAVRMSRESGGVNPKIYLYSPNGEIERQVATSSYPGLACQMDHTLQNTGQYTIVVMDKGADGSGSYSLTFLLIPGKTTSSTDSDDGQIHSGDNINGKIDLKADMDAFTVSANAGQSIAVRMSRESGGVNPKIYLYSPNGEIESQAATNSYPGVACQMEHTLQNTGQYTIVVMDDGADGIGNYSLSLTIIGSGSQDTPDVQPNENDADGDGISNTDDTDDDNDGYIDYIEDIMGTDPLDYNSKPIDSDNDGIPDLIDDDDDNDGYTDNQENIENTNSLDEADYPQNVEQQDTDQDGFTDNIDDDDDNDGYTDLQELFEETNPLDINSYPINIEKLDTDQDGIFDSVDTDDDDDGMPDHWELFYGFNPFNNNDAEEDADEDIFSNSKEFLAGSNPRDKNDYPNKGLSPLETLLRVLALIGGAVTIGGLIYTVYKKPVWVFIRKMKKCTNIDELEKLWKNGIKPEIDKKNIKSKQIQKIKEYYNEQKSIFKKGKKPAS